MADQATPLRKGAGFRRRIELYPNSIRFYPILYPTRLLCQTAFSLAYWYDMGEAQVELVLDVACVLGESPIWCESSQRLYFVDIESRILHILEANMENRLVGMPQKIGTIVPTTKPDTILAALEGDVVEACVAVFQLIVSNSIVSPACLESAYVGQTLRSAPMVPWGGVFSGERREPGCVSSPPTGTDNCFSATSE
jgi:SMP-30/Gluconolactonase/LRE-like region